MSSDTFPEFSALISEFQPNPNGADPTNVSVELSGAPGTLFSGWIISIESDTGTSAGTVDRATAVSGTFDGDGLLVVIVPDFENPSFTIALLDAFTGTVGTTDIDTDNDGTADDLTTFGTVYDAIGVPDTTGEPLYGTDLGGVDFVYTGDEPRLIFRDANDGDLYAINDPDNGEVYDLMGTDVTPAVFGRDPTAGTDTFGTINPSRDIDIAVGKTVDPAHAFAGDTITYTIVFTSEGKGTAPNVVITDFVPLLSPVVVSSSVLVTQTGASPFVWEVGDVPAQLTGTITITGRVPVLTITLPIPGFIVFTNTVEINATNDITGTNNSASVPVTFCENTMNVDNMDELNDAIACYNQRVGGNHRINITDSFILLTTTTPITNITGASLTINGNDNTIDGDNAYRHVLVQSGLVTIQNIVLQNGMGDNGGAVALMATGHVTVTNSTLYSNTASGNGGAIFSGSVVRVFNSTINDNRATNGSGIHNLGSVYVTNSTLSDNVATQFGGGIYSQEAATVVNSTISGNHAQSGGGVYNTISNATINNSTLFGNSATGSGGGIFNSAQTIVRNSIVAGSSSGGDCSNSDTLTAGTDNLDSDDTCGSANQSSSINLDSLADNGCTTQHSTVTGRACVQTMALLPSSVAIDNTNSDSGTATSADQRDTAIVGTRRDIGAFEATDTEVGVIKTVETVNSINTIPSDPMEAFPGETVTFTIVFSNSGAVAANDVVITDVLPAELTNTTIISSGVPITQSGSAFIVGTLLNGGGGIITITGQLSPTATTFTNTATITATNDVSTTNNSTVATVTVPTTLLLLKDTIPDRDALTQFNYTIDLPPGNGGGGGVLIDGGRRVHSLPIITNGVITFTETLFDGWIAESIACVSNFNNIMTVTNTPSINLTPMASEQITCTITNVLPPDVVLTKTVSPVEALPGERVTYTIAFANAEGITSTNVTITDAIPAELTNITVISSGVAITQTSTAPYRWEIADLLEGVGGIITVTGQLSTTAVTFTNTATITATDDVTTTNNSSSAVVTVPAVLRVIKDAIPDSTQNFDIGVSTQNSGAGGSIREGQDAVTMLIPGTVYTLSERITDGWYLESITCQSNVNGATTVSNTQAISFSLAPSEQITCTLTNIALGKLTIEKVAVTNRPNSPIFTFTHPITPTDTFTLTDGVSTTFNVLSGTYAITETVPDGWVQTDADCSNGDALDSIEVALAQDVTCTITNTQLVTLEIDKETDFDVPGTFVFDITGTTDISGTVNLTATVVVTGVGDFDTELIVPAGIYTITERPQEGWIQLDSICELNRPGPDPIIGFPEDGVEFFPGNSVDCDFINTRVGFVVTKTAGTTAADIGDEVTYTYLIQNIGDTGVFSITVNDDKLGAIQPQFSDLFPGETTFALATYTVTENDLPTPLVNTVVVTGFPGFHDFGPPFLPLFVFTDTMLTATDMATVTVRAESMLVVTKTASASTAVVGDMLTYDYSVTNTGNDTVMGITAVDDVLGAVTLMTTTLVPGETTTGILTMTVMESDLPGPILNTVVVSGTGTSGQMPSATDNAIINLNSSPNLAITKTASATLVSIGDTIIYTYTVVNTGDLTLNGIIALDDKLGNLTMLTTTLAANGGTDTVTMTHVATEVDAPILLNTVVVTGTTIDNQMLTASSGASVVVGINPAIVITKSVNMLTAQAGDTLTYTYVTHNVGDITLIDITAVDSNLGIVPLPSDTLAPNEMMTGTLTYVVTESDSSIILNTVVITGNTFINEPVSDNDTAVVTVLRAPAFVVEKSADALTGTTGGMVTYTINVTNMGEVTGAAWVTDTFTAGLLNPSCNWLDPVSGTAMMTTGDLATQVTLGGGDGVAITCTATFDVGLDAVQLPISQTIVPGTAALFTVTLSNTGSLTLTHITVDDFPTSTNCERNGLTLAPNEQLTYTCFDIVTEAGYFSVVTATADVPDIPNIASVLAVGDPPVDLVQDGAMVTVDPPSAVASNIATVTLTDPITITNEITNTNEVTVTNEITNTNEVTVTNEITNTNEVTTTIPVTETIVVTETVVVTNTNEVTTTIPVTETVIVTETIVVTNTNTVTDTVLVTETEIITDSVVVTDTIIITNSVDVTETMIVTNVVTVTDTVVITTNVIVTEVVITMTGTVVVTTVVPITTIVPITEVVVVTDTQIVTTTVDVTNTVIVTETAVVTNTVTVTNSNTITRFVIVTDTVVVTDTVTLTDSVVVTETVIITETVPLLGIVNGRIFHDTDKDGAFEPDDEDYVLPNVVVSLQYPDGQTVEQMTDNDGLYRFDALSLDQLYTVAVDVRTLPSDKFANGTVGVDSVGGVAAVVQFDAVGLNRLETVQFGFGAADPTAVAIYNRTVAPTPHIVTFIFTIYLLMGAHLIIVGRHRWMIE